MHVPSQNRPISVHRSYWLGDFVAWGPDGGHCDCGKKPNHVAIDTWNFSPHPNRFHHLNYRNTSSDLDRSAQIPMSISYPNAKRHTVARYSYAWAPTGKKKVHKEYEYLECFCHLNCVQIYHNWSVLWVNKSPWVLMMAHLLHPHPV